MNGDPISREAAIEKLREELELGNELEYSKISAADAFVIAIRRVKRLPAVDAAPVVRCRECKCRGTNDCPMYMSFYDGEEDYYSDRSTDDGFCHCGAKMDGDADA